MLCRENVLTCVDVVSVIVSYLPDADVQSARRVCSVWKAAIDTPHFWRAKVRFGRSIQMRGGVQARRRWGHIMIDHILNTCSEPPPATMQFTRDMYFNAPYLVRE